MERVRILPLILAIACGSVAATSAAWLNIECHHIMTEGVGQIDLATNSSDGRFIGRGLLHGRTHGEFAFTTLDTTTGIGTFEGTFKIFTRHGTVTLQVTHGEFNQMTGTFSNDGTIIKGTGRFRRASGELFFKGVVASDGSYTDDISGDVCLDSRSHDRDRDNDDRDEDDDDDEDEATH